MKSDQFITPLTVNQDADERVLKPTECRDALNLISGTVDGSNAPWRENIKGTTEIPNAYYNNGDVLIHSVEDIQTDSVLLFVYNKRQEYNKILRWYPATNVIERVLQHEYLNFQKNHAISADVVNGLLYWTDGYFNSFISSDYNPPRKINIEKAKKFSDRYYSGTTCAKFAHVMKWSSDGVHYYTKFRLLGNICPFVTGKEVVCWTEKGDTYGFRHKKSTGFCTIQSVTVVGLYAEVYTNLPWGGGSTPQARNGHILAYETDMYFGIDWQTLDRVKYKPQTDMSVSYDNDTTQKINKLRNNLYQFCYRYIYDDNEKTVWSKPSDIALPATYNNINGSFTDLSPVDNVINVWVDSGPLEVKTVEIAVREGNKGEWRLVDRKEKYDEDGEIIINSDIFVLYPFYNIDLGEPLLEDDVARPFDFVPQISGTEALIEKNRILDSNYTEGYDNLDIDVTLTPEKRTVSLGASELLTTSFTSQKILWNVKDGTQYGGWGGIIDLGPIFARGYTYLISISASPCEYGFQIDKSFDEDWLKEAFSEEHSRDIVLGYAIVDAPIGGTFRDFSDAICAQLRRGSMSGDASVIACNQYDYKYWGTTESVVDYIYGSTSSTYWLSAQELGFVFELNQPYAYFPSAQSLVYPNLSVNVYRTGVITPTTGFKSGAIHPFGLVYYDRAGRCGAVNQTPESQVYIPLQTEVTSTALRQNVISWQISHTPPDWADYYRWVYAGNTTENYFLQTIITNIASLDANGYVYFEVNRIIADMADVSNKFNIRPYVWQKGDRIRFMYKRTDGEYKAIDGFLDFEIIGPVDPRESVYLLDKEGDFIVDKDGNKIKDQKKQGFTIDAFDYESYGISANNTIVEIYRPAPKKESLSYYEFGKTYPIVNAHTANRMHGGEVNQSTLVPASGTFTTGDVYLIMRLLWSVFPVESAWYSDYFDSEVMNIGLPNGVNRNMRRQRFISNLRWSGRKIENTMVNELSKNNASDYETLAERFESIYSIREDGYTLKVLQKNKPTSIYIGKAGLKQAGLGGQDIVTISDTVLGSKAVWENDYGTVFPCSVIKSHDYLYFYDIYNGCVIRWASNGMVPISDYGMKKYFRDKSKALLASGIQNIHVYSTFDKEFGHYIISFVDDLTPANNATWIFSESDNAWITRESFTPAWLGNCGTYVFSSPPTGKLYTHNTNAIRNNFYGVQYNSEITFASNDQPNANKVFNAIAVHSNKKWSAPDTGDISINSNGVVMQSRLKEAQFQTREGIHTAAFLRDMCQSGVEKLDDLHNGRALRGESIKVKLTNTDTSEAVLFGINVKSTISE